jgi:hypothetical protein
LVDEPSRQLSQKKKKNPTYVNTIKVILVPSPPLTPKKKKKRKERKGKPNYAVCSGTLFSGASDVKFNYSGRWRRQMA